MISCDFGVHPERASQFVAVAFQTNASLTDLRRLSALVPKTRRSKTFCLIVIKFCLVGFTFRLGNVETLQKAFRNIPHLSEINLSACRIDDVGVGIFPHAD
jgi:hypothetical protein